MILFEYRSVDSSPISSTNQSGDPNTTNSSASRLSNTVIDNNQTLFPLSILPSGLHQNSTEGTSTNFSLSVKDSNATNLAQKQELISSYIQQHQPSNIQSQPNQQIPLAQLQLQQQQQPLNQSQPQSYTDTPFLMQQQPFAGLQKQPSQPYQPPMQQQQPLQQQPQQNQPLTQPYPPSFTQQLQWLPYEDPVNGIRIQIPSNWQIGQSDKIVEFRLPSTTKPSFGSGPALDASLSISMQSVGSYHDTNTSQVKAASLQDYVTVKKNEISSSSTPTGGIDYRLEYLKDYPTIIDRNPAWKIEYMSYFLGRQGLYNIETYVIKDNILYTLEFWSDPLKVPETLSIAQQIIDSFQITRQ